MLAALILQLTRSAVRAIESVPTAPNVLVVVLDDVGEVDTQGLPLPNLANLAAHGLRLRAAYASPTCARTRRSIPSGSGGWTPPGAPAGA